MKKLSLSHKLMLAPLFLSAALAMPLKAMDTKPTIKLGGTPYQNVFVVTEEQLSLLGSLALMVQESNGFESMTGPDQLHIVRHDLSAFTLLLEIVNMALVAKEVEQILGKTDGANAEEILKCAEQSKPLNSMLQRHVKDKTKQEIMDTITQLGGIPDYIELIKASSIT